MFRRQQLCNNIFAWVLSLSFLTLTFAGCSGCESLVKKAVAPPEVQIRGVTIANLNFQTADLLVDLDITNPNSYELNVSKVEGKVEVEGKSIFDGILAENIKLPGKQTSAHQVKLSLPVQEVLGALGNFVLNGQAQYKITGRVHSGLISVPINSSGTLRRD